MGHGTWAGWFQTSSSKYAENVVTTVAAEYLNLSLDLLKNMKN